MHTISILAVVDVVAGLAANSLDGQVYLIDDNKDNGSTNEGTQTLKTVAVKGDRIVWTNMSLEVEAFASIDDIEIDDRFHDTIRPEKNTYEGTNVVYWVGVVKKDLDRPIHYKMRFNLGSRKEPLSTTAKPSLVGADTSAKKAEAAPQKAATTAKKALPAPQKQAAASTSKATKPS